MYHGKVCFLGSTSPWSKKYFIFVSTLDYLQREHYWSSFSLLPSSGFFVHVLPLLSIIFFYCYFESLGGMWGIQLSHNTDSVSARVVDAEMKKKKGKRKNSRVFALVSQWIWVVSCEKGPQLQSEQQTLHVGACTIKKEKSFILQHPAEELFCSKMRPFPFKIWLTHGRKLQHFDAPFKG